MEALFHGHESDAGIYLIRNSHRPDFPYVGSAANFKNRFKIHKSTLGRGKHVNRGLQEDYLKYGASSFSFEVIAIVPTAEKYRATEIEIIRDLWPCCYNLTIQSLPSMLGRCHTEEAKKRIGAASRGKPRSEAVKAKISASHLGMKHTQETCEKISSLKRGRPLSEDHRRKIGDAHLGRKRPPEVGEKIRAKKLGRPYGPMSPEHKVKISMALKRKFASEAEVSHG